MDQPTPAPDRGLRDHLGVLRRRLPIIVGITVLTVLAAVGYSLMQPTVYQATVDVLYRQDQATVQDPSQDQLVLSKRLDPNRVMQNEVKLAGSQVVRDRVIQKTGSASSVSAQNVKDSDVITITAPGSSADRAADNANAWADAYVEVSREQSSQDSSASLDAIAAQVKQIDDRTAEIDRTLANSSTSDADRAPLSAERTALVALRAGWTQQQSQITADQALAAQNQVLVLTRATPPGSPSQPATLRNALLALLVGLGLALVVAYAVDQIDDVIRTPDDLERATGLALVAAIAGPTSDRVRAVAIDDPVLRRGGTGPTDILDDVDPGPDTRILLVPTRSHARKVRQTIAMLEGVGMSIVGVALVQPDTARSGSAATPSSPTGPTGPANASAAAPVASTPSAPNDEVRDPVPG